MITEKELLEIVAAEVKRQKVSQAELAHKLRVNPSSISGIFHRGKIRIDRLVQFSEVLNYNFFQAAANRLDIPSPEPKIYGEEVNVTDYQNQIRELETKISIMEQTYTSLIKEILDKK